MGPGPIGMHCRWRHPMPFGELTYEAENVPCLTSTLCWYALTLHSLNESKQAVDRVFLLHTASRCNEAAVARDRDIGSGRP